MTECNDFLFNTVAGILPLNDEFNNASILSDMELITEHTTIAITS